MLLNATFDKLLESVEPLPTEAQEDLVSLIQRRLAEQGRRRIVDEIRQGRSEFETGTIKPTSVDDLMREIES